MFSMDGLTAGLSGISKLGDIVARQLDAIIGHLAGIERALAPRPGAEEQLWQISPATQAQIPASRAMALIVSADVTGRYALSQRSGSGSSFFEFWLSAYQPKSIPLGVKGMPVNAGTAPVIDITLSPTATVLASLVLRQGDHAS